MESWSLVIAVLAAVLVGALVPVLIQLRSTLRVLETTLLRTSGRLDEALVTVAAATGKIELLTSRLIEGGQLERLVQDVSALSRLASQVGDVVRVASAVGAAVGPAVAAGLRALREDPPPPTPPRGPFTHVDYKHVKPQARRRAAS
jgi:hypothetical protein